MKFHAIRRNTLLFSSILLATLPPLSNADGVAETEQKNSLVVQFTNSTQGNFWPPSTVADKNGDFILYNGVALTELDDGGVVPMPGTSVIISKNTVPPLNTDGEEDFSNPFGAGYKVVKTLDLSPGSPDLDMELFSLSWGPYEGNFNGGARIPRVGESEYNLNPFNYGTATCSGLFPSSSQRFTYTRPSFPMNEVPIFGFMGDQIDYDPDTGEEFIPRNQNGSDCPADGCLGEDNIHQRSAKKITLGDWIKAKIVVNVKLVNYDRDQQAYTAARFRVNADNLLPNSVYQLSLGRSAFLQGSPLFRIPHAPAPAAAMITDSHGNGTMNFQLDNPFPAFEEDDAGTRIVGMGFVYKSDASIYGVCSYVIGSGVDAHSVATTFADGSPDEFDSLVTKAPRDW